MSLGEGNQEVGLRYVLELTDELEIPLVPKGEGTRQLLFDTRTDMIDRCLADFWLDWMALQLTLDAYSSPR